MTLIPIFLSAGFITISDLFLSEVRAFCSCEFRFLLVVLGILSRVIRCSLMNLSVKEYLGVFCCVCLMWLMLRVSFFERIVSLMVWLMIFEEAFSSFWLIRILGLEVGIKLNPNLRVSISWLLKEMGPIM